MTTPNSGTIALSNIQSEFGGSAPIDFSEYNRGGAYLAGNDDTFAVIPTPTNASRNMAMYYGKTRTEYITTYGLSWGYADTYYGYVEIYRGGKVRLYQQTWCPHSNVWWGQSNSGNVKMWNDAKAYTSMGQLVSQDPYGSKRLYHDGGSLVLYNGGTLLAARSAPLVW